MTDLRLQISDIRQQISEIRFQKGKALVVFGIGFAFDRIRGLAILARL